jgi:hypothetical protein
VPRALRYHCSFLQWRGCPAGQEGAHETNPPDPWVHPPTQWVHPPTAPAISSSASAGGGLRPTPPLWFAARASGEDMDWSGAGRGGDRDPGTPRCPRGGLLLCLPRRSPGSMVAAAAGVAGPAGLGSNGGAAPTSLHPLCSETRVSSRQAPALRHARARGRPLCSETRVSSRQPLRHSRVAQSNYRVRAESPKPPPQAPRGLEADHVEGELQEVRGRLTPGPVDRLGNLLGQVVLVLVLVRRCPEQLPDGVRSGSGRGRRPPPARHLNVPPCSRPCPCCPSCLCLCLCRLFCPCLYPCPCCAHRRIDGQCGGKRRRCRA